jgi:hypothetical protein
MKFDYEESSESSDNVLSNYDCRGEFQSPDWSDNAELCVELRDTILSKGM